MKHSPFLEFRSSSFPVVPGEDDATNPGIFGKALANWLAEQLRAQNFVSGEVIPEDFGWCVPVESKPHALYVACVSADETSDSWRVFVFAEGGLLSRLIGKDKRAESVAALFTAIKHVLHNSPDIQGLHEETM